ncbi:hypothetical protein SAMN05877753_103257 [Bacillus oleivorans]|uniref:Uncharacterized protein n=1 Tax=Bacillus oleivorans TaxID=1448271 RepID=A0A285CQP4_9BACI|nr:hypothetical protein [Bacillus oleivorans]SNX69841.1 hypothetical protein SAMN05877753_103257 [Bacillus oleivorans]
MYSIAGFITDNGTDVCKKAACCTSLFVNGHTFRYSPKNHCFQDPIGHTFRYLTKINKKWPVFHKIAEPMS